MTQLNALRTGHLAGAALDTYTHEPLRPDDPLLAVARDPQSNLMLTPHVGAGSPPVGVVPRSGDYANIIALLAGKPLRYRLT